MTTNPTPSASALEIISDALASPQRWAGPSLRDGVAYALLALAEAPTKEMVEAHTQAFHEGSGLGDSLPWTELIARYPGIATKMRLRSRTALVAALRKAAEG